MAVQKKEQVTEIKRNIHMDIKVRFTGFFIILISNFKNNIKWGISLFTLYLKIQNVFNFIFSLFITQEKGKEMDLANQILKFGFIHIMVRTLKIFIA